MPHNLNPLFIDQVVKIIIYCYSFLVHYLSCCAYKNNNSAKISSDNVVITKDWVDLSL